MLIKKNKGDLTGWIGYTLSKTTRYFEDVNQGNPFPAKYDRRHDLSITTSYQLNDKWTLSGVFVYSRVITLLFQQKDMSWEMYTLNLPVEMDSKWYHITEWIWCNL